MQSGYQSKKHRQFSKLPTPMFRIVWKIFFFSCLFLFLSPANSLNTDKGVAVDHRVSLTSSSIKHVLNKESQAGNEPALLNPHANPYALLADSGKITVRFSVPMQGKSRSTDIVYLRRIGEKNAIAMNDIGKSGDFKAGDNIFGINILIDTSKVKSDSCLKYEAFTRINRTELTSPPLKFCVSSLPVYLAVPNTDNTVEFPDGSKAVGDEILLRATLEASAADIKQIARNFNAKIAGSDLNLNLYQLKLPSPVKINQLLEIISRIKSQKGVANAFVNALGSYSFTPSDTDFTSQHGLQLVRAHDAWDANTNANGVGNTVIVLDSGIDRSHVDFGTSPGNCQLAEDDCGMASTDTLGHGTQVAGVVSARTNNATGIAGVAFGTKIHSIQVSPIISIAATQMITGFNLARDYIAIHAEASVINASFSVGVGAASASEWNSVCLAIDQAVFNGAARAIVVNAVGNLNANGTLYPARCNDLNANLDITRKNLLITVANSTSVVTPDCGSVAIDQRCSTSNYGAWVDIAGPGSAIRTTALGGGYVNPTGTSFSAPIVSGAVAILRSCGVPLTDIESTLRTSAIVSIPFPGGTSAPRLDIFRALQQRNRLPTGVTISNTSILENTNTATGFEVGTLTADDLDICDKFTYTINGGTHAALFSIVGVGLDRLRLTAGVLDADTINAYNVTVRVTDFFGQTFDQPITVNITNINEAPIGNNNTLTILEDSVHTFSAANFGFSDTNDVPPNNLSAVIITTTPAAGTLALSGVPVIAGQSVAAASIGSMTFTPAPNANGDDYTSFTFQVVDNGGTANGGVNTDPTPNTLTFHVTPVNNDPPTGVPIVNGVRSLSSPAPQLSADTSGISNPDAWAITQYQWLRSDTPNTAGGIPVGTNASTYTLATPGDLGKYIGVCVTFTGSMPPSVTLCSGSGAIAVGDPHFTTVDGLHFDFQSAGEFVMLRGANGMEIQARLTPVSTAAPLADNYSGLPVGVSINTAVAARVGNHRVSLQQNPIAAAAANGLVVSIDGVKTTLPSSGINFSAGGRIVPIDGGAYQIDFPNGTTLIVTPGWWASHNVWYLNLNVQNTVARDGVMGVRDSKSWLPRLSNGTSLGAMPAAMHDRYVDLYETFANSWRVTNESSLFDYARDTSTANFTLKDWPRENPPHVVPQGGRVIKPLKREIALQHCRAFAGKKNHADCVFDVMVTGHAGFAKTMLLAQKIQDGLTATVVRVDKDIAEPNRNLRFIATVIKHAPAAVLVTDGKDIPAGAAATNLAPSGFIQFKLNGNNIGERLRLDAKGQAVLSIPREKVGGGQIAASFLPAKGSVFLPSSSSNLSYSFEELQKRSRVLKEAK